MKDLVDHHPVLKALPDHVKKSLPVEPGEWSDLPGNKRQRKRWRRDGVVVHLYAGESTGFTMSRSWKQQGGEEAKLLEIDVKRDERHDMLKDKGVYSGLIRAAVDGRLKGIIGGPNCRTRSKLRHFPIKGREDCPRPIRTWRR